MQLLEHPQRFKEGVRIIMMLRRSKDGGKGNVDRHAFKFVTNGPEEYDAIIKELSRTWEPGLRIYSTVDKRDVKKASRRFKELMLENDYTPDPDRFYIDIDNRWVSALQQPTSRAESLFLFDFDDHEITRKGIEILAQYEADDITKDHYVHGYATKNGWHIITKPFNYTKLPEWMHPMIHKNAMLLVAY